MKFTTKYTTLEYWRVELSRLLWSFENKGRPDGKTGVVGTPKTIEEWIEETFVPKNEVKNALEPFRWKETDILKLLPDQQLLARRHNDDLDEIYKSLKIK